MRRSSEAKIDTRPTGARALTARSVIVPADGARIASDCRRWQAGKKRCNARRCKRTTGLEPATFGLGSPLEG